MGFSQDGMELTIVFCLSLQINERPVCADAAFLKV
jgi:hypothetical protein